MTEGMEQPELTHEQTVAIRTVSSIIIAYNLILIVCAIYIFSKYLLRVESIARRTEIKLFYALVWLGSVIFIMLQISNVVKPGAYITNLCNGNDRVHQPMLKVYTTLQSIASAVYFLEMTVIIYTLSQLSIALSLVNDLTEAASNAAKR